MFFKRVRAQLSTWSQFISRQSGVPDIDPLVSRSWRRCLPRLNPHQDPAPRRLTNKNLLAAQSTHFEFISVARPIMEDTYQFIEGTDAVILLVNHAGYILDMVGASRMLSVLAEHDLFRGTSMAEEQLGTNAFALALVERTPALVVGPEHFLQKFHGMTDAAAPIFDLTGRPLGAIGMVTPAHEEAAFIPGLVVAGARAIEAQQQSELLLQEQISRLSELNAILSTISEGILVLNSDGVLMHTNPAASRILGLELSALVGRPLTENLQLPTFIHEAISERQTLTHVDANLTAGGRTVNCLVGMQHAGLPDESPWVILTLQEARALREMIQLQVGPQVRVGIEDFVGPSRQIARMRAQARAAAPARASVLIRGESGTGKDYLARALHNASPRRDKPFLIFSCSSVPSELILGELLGLEQGPSFPTLTGRPSKFELAHTGTLFFQDIQDLPREAQALLLKVLELSLIERLGGSIPVEVDVRILASTTANLENMVADGHFRADLYYRLSTFEINIPPLRERPADIPILAQRILSRLAEQHQRKLALSPAARQLLRRYHWPGNHRELEAALERATLQAGSSELIDPSHLPRFVRHTANQPGQQSRLTNLPSLKMVQRDAIIQAARACNGNITQMAEVLGISRTTVWRKMKTLDISADKFRPSGVMTRDGSN